LPQGLIFWAIKVDIKFLDQGYINATIKLPGQGFMPPPPLELPAELVELGDK